MTALSAFVALEPSPSLAACIIKAKGLVRERVGPQKYLQDPPHLTLQVGCFPVLEPVMAALEKIAVILTRPSVELAGWHVFMHDPLTDGHTVVTSLQEACRSKLRLLQAQTLEAVAPLRDRTASLQRYQPHWTQLSSLRQRSIETWGFPFTGSDWQPHVTVGSINPAQWETIWPELQAMAPHGPHYFSEIVLYHLDAQQAATKLVSFPLAAS